MARTKSLGCRKPNIPFYKKADNMWFQRWSQIPKYNIKELTHYIKLLLKYYPKRSRSLIPLTSTSQLSTQTEYSNAPQEKSVPEIRRLYSRVIFRYKKEFLPHQHANLDWKYFPLWKTCRTAHTLKLSQSKDTQIGFNTIMKKTLKANKDLKILELGNLTCSEEITSYMRYVRTLTSIYLKNMSSVPLQRWEKVFFASALSLQSVTLTGDLDYQSTNQTPGDIVKLLRFILELPNLKKFNFDCKTSKEFDINKIPFMMLKTRNISYNIRLTNHQDEFRLSVLTELGLNSLDYLGVNTIKYWPNQKIEWNILQENQLKAQEKAQQVLFVSIFEMKTADLDLSRLLVTCQNIKTLDISLSVINSLGISFTGLKLLQNLQNLFIRIDNITDLWAGNSGLLWDGCYNRSLFQNLIFCAKTLKSVSIHIGGYIQYESDIQDFFAACSETLTHLTLMFSYFYGIPDKIIHKATLLKRLQCFNLLYDRIGYNFAQTFPQLEEFVLCNSVKEFCLSTIKLGQVHVDIPNFSNLERLRLEIYGPDEKIFQQLVGLTHLKHLELSFYNIHKDLWKSLLKMLGKLKELETVKLKCISPYFQAETEELEEKGEDYEEGDETEDEESEAEENKKKENKEQLVLVQFLSDLTVLKENHPNLMSLCFAEESLYPETVWLIGKSLLTSSADIDNFLGSNKNKLPGRRIYKVYSL